MYAKVWRFLPALDPQVDLLHVRDLDSSINPRELSAVEDFMNSSKEFHVMRDHPQHGIEVLAGLWGVKLTSNMREKMKEAFEATIQSLGHKYGMLQMKTLDQTILQRFVW